MNRVKAAPLLIFLVLVLSSCAGRFNRAQSGCRRPWQWEWNGFRRGQSFWWFVWRYVVAEAITVVEAGRDVRGAIPFISVDSAFAELRTEAHVEYY